MNFRSIRHLAISFLLLSNTLVFSQINTGILPESFKTNASLATVPQAQLTPPNLNLLKVQNEENEKNGTMVYVAKTLPIEGNTLTAGTWEKTDSGRDIWRMSISSQGALGCMLYFSKFELPVGAQLFVYNPEGSVILGPYTHKDNPNHVEYTIGMIYGEEAIIEYVAPQTKSLSKSETSVQFPDIELSGYAYVFRDVMDLRATGYGASESCEVNVNCSEGDNWRTQQKGVAKIYVVTSEGGGYCTGTLVNNTGNDGTPYFLTADHCGGNTTASYFNRWVFYFNYESAGCTSSSPANLRSVTGCTRKARSDIDGGSDFLLLELNTTAETLKDIGAVYNGWDNSGTGSTSGVGIHHPAGDIKKISTYTRTLSSSTYYDSDATGLSSAHWTVRWASTTNGTGVTEGGSSGSPLFNSNGLVIGTLSGGSSSCSATSASDLYGKVSVHWDENGTTDDVKLQPWLDPQNTGATTCTILEPNSDFFVSSNSLEFNQTASSQQISVHAGSSEAAWTSSASQSWISLSRTTGAGSSATTAVTVSVLDNTDVVERTGTITFVHDTATIIISVLQKGISSVEYGFSYDFEDCTNFAVDDFAPCTTQDVDGSGTYGIEGIDFDNSNYTGSFMAFNSSATSPASTTEWAAQQGSKCGACFAATLPANNDWFITPAVNLGTGSALSFWAKSVTDEYGLERFKVLVSTTDNNTSSFTAISAGSYLEAPTTWTEYTYDLSAYNGQTVYIAIQCVSNDAFAFLIDNINVSTTATSIKETAGNEQFAIYPNPAENYISIQTTENTSLQIFDISGRLVKTLLAANKAQVYVGDLSSGIYYVKAGSHVVKLLRK